jgi:hypothetical protein
MSVSPEADDEPLQLHQEALCAALRQVVASDDLVRLRAGVAALRQQLVAGELRADTGNGVTVGQTYLQGELDQITAAHTLERARYYVERLLRALTEERTGAINDINLNRWKEYDDLLTDSLWHIARRDDSGAHHAGYWGNFVPQIPNQMMRRYTKRGEWVLDAFAGSGTTLIEGRRLGRNVLGVELQPLLVERVRANLEREPNRYDVASELESGDSTQIDFGALLARHGARGAQLALLHPPYLDIIRFSDDARDLSNCSSVEIFLAQLGRVVDGVAAVLDKGRYLALVIGDVYRGGEWLPLGFRAMETVQQRGFVLKSIVVKNFEDTLGKRAQKDLWRYRALVGGFYVFKHEYIFVFKKR